MNNSKPILTSTYKSYYNFFGNSPFAAMQFIFEKPQDVSGHQIQIIMDKDKGLSGFSDNDAQCRLSITDDKNNFAFYDFNLRKVSRANKNIIEIPQNEFTNPKGNNIQWNIIKAIAIEAQRDNQKKFGEYKARSCYLKQVKFVN